MAKPGAVEQKKGAGKRLDSVSLRERGDSNQPVGGGLYRGEKEGA